jgi:hypothetical protein
MKKILLLACLWAALPGISQKAAEAEKKIIHQMVNDFFAALLSRDAARYSTLVMPGGSITTVRYINDSLKNATRSFEADMAALGKSTQLMQEEPFSIDISIHRDIAVAWVPYSFSLDGKQLHCGVDVFTFLRTPNGWKIASLAYSAEPDGCNAWQKKREQ